MKRAEELKGIRDLLTKRREDTFRIHARAQDACRSLMEPEVEFEETAQNDSMADAISRLGEQERLEIEAIDHALKNIETGKYGFCEVCGKPIAAKRLSAVPWTLLCALHAKEKSLPKPETFQTTTSFPLEYEGSVRSEGSEIIADEIREDGNIDFDELKISVRAGQLHLEGFLPSEAQRRRLLEIVQGHLEFDNVVDEVIVSRAPWEEGAPDNKEIEDVLEEIVTEDSEQGETSARKERGSV